MQGNRQRMRTTIKTIVPSGFSPEIAWLISLAEIVTARITPTPPISRRRAPAFFRREFRT